MKVVPYPPRDPQLGPLLKSNRTGPTSPPGDENLAVCREERRSVVKTAYQHRPYRQPVVGLRTVQFRGAAEGKRQARREKPAGDQDTAIEEKCRPMSLVRRRHGRHGRP